MELLEVGEKGLMMVDVLVEGEMEEVEVGIDRVDAVEGRTDEEEEEDDGRDPVEGALAIIAPCDPMG